MTRTAERQTMDRDAFDALTKTLAAAGSRRVLGGAMLRPLGLRATQTPAAAKKTKKPRLRSRRVRQGSR